MYDVEEKKCQKVFKICKKYLSHFQKSIFRGKITPSQLISLRNEIKKVINKDTDTITIIKMIGQSSFEEETHGFKYDYGEELIL
ncbi:CRISPR-associated endonuclease Cas2 [Fusibacter sp. 3D3]|uniref:CRISPR-associated endonuclease Cas2 n=1 Tax=Fusibacter sp. 3D3 TaxID=1048380 RepID=UPI000853CB9C|nr:CRISPR-associated endonuclease Cas2 [Fusibacter sp. 3D3]